MTRVLMLSDYTGYVTGREYVLEDRIASNLINDGLAEIAPDTLILSDELIRPADTTAYADGDAITKYTAAVKQKETLTLTGVFGTATILCGGVSKVATFNTNLDTTASDFVTANAATWLAVGIVLTSSGADLVFEASIAGVPFTAPTITYVTSDLDGTIVNTTANVVAVKQKETLTLTGTFGNAVLECAGLTKIIAFNTDLGTTASDTATAYAADFLAVGVVLTADGSDLVFEASVAGTSFVAPTVTTQDSDLAGEAASVNANVVAVKQKETITLTGTNGFVILDGTLANHLLEFSASLADTASGYVTAKAADYLAGGVVLTSDGADLIFEASVAGTPFTAPTIENATGDFNGTVDHTTANVVAVKQKDSITLTGTIGHALVTVAGGLSKALTYDTNLVTTAANFVTAHAATYAAQGIVVTSTDEVIFFESDTAGTPFDSPVIANVASDVDGTVAHTTANVVAVKQKDTLTLTGTAGKANVGAAGGLTKAVTFNTDYATTTADFVTAHATVYDAQGIVVTSNGANIIFEAKVAGTSFTHPTITTLANLAGTVAHTTANVTIPAFTFENVSYYTGGKCKLNRVSLWSNMTGFAGKKVRVWLYGAFPTDSAGDNTAFVGAYAKQEKQFFVDVTFNALVTGADNVYGEVYVDQEFKPTAKNMYALLQATEAITPTSGGKITVQISITK